MSQAYGQKVTRGLEQMESALEEVRELGQWGCRMCWIFKGAKEARGHKWTECAEIKECQSFRGCMEFQGRINHRRDRQAQFLSYFYCHVSQELCQDGYKGGGKGCQWKHVVIPAAIAATTEEGRGDLDPATRQEAHKAKTKYHHRIKSHKEQHWQDFLDDQQNTWKALAYLNSLTRATTIPTLQKDGQCFKRDNENAQILLQTFFPP
jgi:hypothetical protein